MRDLFVPTAPEPAEPVSADLAKLTSPRLRDDALRARASVLAEFEQLYGARPSWHYRRAAKRIRQLLAGSYLQAVNAIREATSQEDLATLRGTLTARLEQGWELEPTPKRDALFERLLAELEIVSDALSDSVMRPYLARLSTLEAGT